MRARGISSQIEYIRQTNIGLFVIDTKAFSSGNRPWSGGPKNKNRKINKTFWGLLGSRHVQTSLEIMWLILFLLFGFRWFFGFFVLFVLSFGV